MSLVLPALSVAGGLLFVAIYADFILSDNIGTLGRSESLIRYVKDRPGHDRRYAIDNTKITTQLGWKPAYIFEQGMEETIEWYVKNSRWIESITSGEYAEYYEKMYSDIDEVAAAGE